MVNFFTVGILLANAIFVNVSAYPLRCPMGLVAYGGSCFKFMRMESTWSEAKVLCETMDAHLVEINDPMKETFLYRHLMQLEVSMAETPLWIGASDMISENVWIWMHSKRHMTYRNWRMKTPNALRRNHGQCLGLQALPGFEWKEIQCTQRLGFICEFDNLY